MGKLNGRHIYLSGAITNNPDAYDLFAMARRVASREGAHIVFNPLDERIQSMRPGWTHEQHMMADLHHLTSGHYDLLLQLPGWTFSGGAQLESAVADMCGIERADWSQYEV